LKKGCNAAEDPLADGVEQDALQCQEAGGGEGSTHEN
jgi:hypothetical protein